MATRILLDTHVWLWMNGEPERLSSTARDLLSDADNVLFLSAASVWEIAIKVASRKLVLPEPPERYITDRLFKNQVTSLPIHHGHALHAAALPEHHRDPFDRMLVAQAQLEGLQLMTVDKKVARYDVDILPGRGSKAIVPQGSTAKDPGNEDPDNEDNEGSDNQDGDNQDGDNQDGDTQDAS